METFQTNPLSLKHLLGSIHERQLALPDFQRDFVWDPRSTEELVESIARSFPAGSLLFMPWRPNAFTPRAVQSAPDLDGLAPNTLILDGQQRLTSLYQACYGRGDYRYFVDLQPLLADDDIEEAVFYRHANRCGPYKAIGQQADRLIMPLGVLFGGGGGFHAWRDTVLARRPEKDDDLTELGTRLLQVHEKYIRPIEDYRFPVVSLDHSTSLEAVCSIFETLNRTGIRLSVFDLLAARFYAQGLDLRRMWERTTEDQAIIDEFLVDKYYVLQSIALRVRGSVKRGDVLRLSAADVEREWDGVTRAYRAALEMLRDECGVKTGKWLPYGYLLVPLAAVWREAIEISGPASGANRERLKRWFWCSGFSQTYDRAANTQAAKDFNELRRWLAGQQEPETVASFAFNAARLREITPKQSVYKALMGLYCAMAPLTSTMLTHSRQPRSPLRASTTTTSFPRAYLNPSGEEPRYPNQLVDCILNRTLIDANTNQRIGKRAPSDYLREIRDELDKLGASDGVFGRVLRSHLLCPGEASAAGGQSGLLEDDFDAFVVWRQDRIAREMSLVTHVQVDAEAANSQDTPLQQPPVPADAQS